MNMRWITASERLPEKLFGTIARYVKTKAILFEFVDWVKNCPERLNEIEWLDESESSSPLKDEKPKSIEDVLKVIEGYSKEYTPKDIQLMERICSYYQEFFEQEIKQNQSLQDIVQEMEKELEAFTKSNFNYNGIGKSILEKYIVSLKQHLT